MKKTILLLSILTLWILFFIWIKALQEKELNIEEIKKSIVIIIPEKDLIEYNRNPEWIFQENESGWIGSWFFISKNWEIITAKHIVPDTKEIYRVITQNNKEYQAKVIYQDEKKDIALLKISTQEEIIPLKIAEEARIWEKIISLWTDIKTLKTMSHYGHIVDTNKKWDHLSHFIYISTPLMPWFSWWPVLNTKWKVVWINYATYKWQSLIQPLESLQW